MGSQLEVLQGSQRWTELAAVYTSVGLGRLVLGGGALLIHPSLDSAMIGLALGAAVPAVLGSVLLRGASGGRLHWSKTYCGRPRTARTPCSRSS